MFLFPSQLHIGQCPFFTTPSSLFKQGLKDHDDGIDRKEFAQMAFPDPQLYGTSAYNVDAAHKEWLRGWDFAEENNPLEDKR